MELRITLMYSSLRKFTYACKIESKNRAVIVLDIKLNFLGIPSLQLSTVI